MIGLIAGRGGARDQSRATLRGNPKTEHHENPKISENQKIIIWGERGREKMLDSDIKGWV